MSFALECHALSWDALKAALTQRKPELLQAVEHQQWSTLLDGTDIGQPDYHLLPYPHEEPGVHARSIPSDIRHGIDEIAEAMARKPSPNQDPPEISDNAALVFAGIVRQMGQPVGTLRHDAAPAKDRDGELPIDFRSLFLDGVAGSCFKDHGLGENLAARPLFGLFHLDFLSWGGLQFCWSSPISAPKSSLNRFVGFTAPLPGNQGAGSRISPRTTCRRTKTALPMQRFPKIARSPCGGWRRARPTC